MVKIYEIMAKHRYLKILNNTHFNNINTTDENRRQRILLVVKLRLVIDKQKANFILRLRTVESVEVYYPEKG